MVLPYQNASGVQSFMLIYGYSETEYKVDDNEPEKMAEVTVVADANELRYMAKFLEHTADSMESNSDQFGHEHLSDYDKRFKNSPEFIVCSKADT
jgi:hypothetical protein